MPLAAEAQTLIKPVGPVNLTISGKIGHKNSVNGAEFDAALIDGLAVTRITTATPWRKAVVTFAGPSLKSLLVLVGATGQTLRMAVLARKIDGVVLQVRDQGPVFMVYPFDDLPALNSDPQCRGAHTVA